MDFYRFFLINLPFWQFFEFSGKKKRYLFFLFFVFFSLQFFFTFGILFLNILRLLLKVNTFTTEQQKWPKRAGNQRFLSVLLVYLKNCLPRLVLLFLTMIWNPKKKYYMIFFIMFHDFRFGLGKVTTHLTYHCLKCSFHTKITLFSK